MAAATIRLGKISSINYTAGKARVVYEDRDDSVTSELPFLALQYNIPKVDDLVVVACFSNGTVSGVILGPVYNSANTPHEGGAGIFRQEMSNNVNEAVMSYSEKKQTMILRAPKIELEGYGYEDKPYVTLEQIMMRSRILMITRPGYPTCRMTQPRQRESRPCSRSWTHWKKE